MSPRPVPPELAAALVRAADATGTVVLPITRPDQRLRLLDALVEAAEAQRAEPGYAAELHCWTHRLADGHDGVPARNMAAQPVGTQSWTPLHRFGHTGLARSHVEPGRHPDDDAASLFVVATPGDSTLHRLRAGEASSAVLLAATRLGLATTPLSQALEVEEIRLRLRRDVLGIPEHPQLVLRIGWPAEGAEPLPPTPRRALGAVLLRT